MFNSKPNVIMTTVTAFPVLLSLQVSPQTIYDFIKFGIEGEKMKMQSMHILENDAQYYRSSSRILEGERLLRFMRINGAPGEITDDLV